jgi:uncharacterized membrane protein YkoI
MGKWRAYTFLALAGVAAVGVGCSKREKNESAEAGYTQTPAPAVAPAPAPTTPAPETAMAAQPGAPQQGVAVKEEKPGLMAKAKVTPEQAQTTALGKVTNGTIKSGELEEEHGKLIYSFDITVPDKEGVTEVHVDAMTGNVIKTEHESAKKEAAEAAKEKKKQQ